MTHTPGPWRLYNAPLRKQFPTPILEIQDMIGKPIVAWLGFDGLERPRVEIAANARLMAAAPELEDALRFIGGICQDNLLLADNPTLALILDAARTAIAKAEGKVNVP